MRKRYQKGSLRKVEGEWIAQYWEDGHRRKKTLGLVSKVPKAQAQKELDTILGPINSRAESPSPTTKWGDFVRNVYLPFYHRKWKRSTRLTNEDWLRVHLTPVYGAGLSGASAGTGFRLFSMKRHRPGCPTASSPTCGGTSGRFSGWQSLKATSQETRLNSCLSRGRQRGRSIRP